MRPPLPPKIAVAIGGALGSALRFAASGGAHPTWIGTLAVNLIGCAVFGWLVGARRSSPALSAGFCGGLTTFSAFAVQLQRGSAGGTAATVALAIATPLLGALVLVLARRIGSGAGPVPGIPVTQEID